MFNRMGRLIQQRQDEDKKNFDESNVPYKNDPTKSGSASDLMGRLLREEWADYQGRFAKYDDKLIELATGRKSTPYGSDLSPWRGIKLHGQRGGLMDGEQEDNLAAINRARAGVSGAFNVAQGTLQRNNERLGLSDAADVSASLGRQSANARSLAEVSVANRTRLHADDRDKSILAGDAAAGLKSGRMTGAQ